MNVYQYVSKLDTQNIYTNIYLKFKKQNNDLHCSTYKTKQRTPSLPHHSEELGAGMCHANLKITKQRNSLP